MPPTLYHVPKSISSPIYQALLELKLVDNPVKVECLTFPQLKSKEHLARNPMGTSPTFTTEDGVTIWESGGVLTYLLEKYDEKNLLAPKKVNAKFLHLQVKYILLSIAGLS